MNYDTQYIIEQVIKALVYGVFALVVFVIIPAILNNKGG